jgi:hypothetical protein
MSISWSPTHTALATAIGTANSYDVASATTVNAALDVAGTAYDAAVTPYLAAMAQLARHHRYTVAFSGLAAPFAPYQAGVPAFAGNLTDTTDANYSAIVSQAAGLIATFPEWFATPAGVDHLTALSAFKAAGLQTVPIASSAVAAFVAANPAAPPALVSMLGLAVEPALVAVLAEATSTIAYLNAAV